MIVNPDARVRVMMVAGAIPVLLIDDFYSDPDAVRAEGLQAAFDQSIALYPGRHAVLDTPASRKVVEHICAVLTALGDRAYDPQTTRTDFSILTTKASDLLGMQKHPHIDRLPVAGVIYLNPGSTQGTCLFRNRILGLHSVVSAEQEELLAKFLEDEGPTYEPETYEVNGNGAWEKLYTVEGRYNRLVLYPGNVFHSIDLRDVPEVFDINKARLTQRILVQNFRPK